MRERWRLIIDESLDGALNMALDRAAQIARERGAAPPTLRLYRWARPTISIGRFQSADELDAGAIERLGCDVVRRHTGGRGVLHDDELTYSVSASVDDGIPRGVAASYRHLCAALAAAYRVLGVPAELLERDAQAAGSAACYLAQTRADLAVDGRKLSGSAQVWSGDCVLQHGSFTRTRDVVREAEVFSLGAEDAERLAGHTSTLASILGRVPEFAEIAQAVCEGFERTLDIDLEISGWTVLEAVEAQATAENCSIRRV